MRLGIFVACGAMGLAGALSLSACSSAGADNTKFTANCLKSANDVRCTCMKAAVRTSLDDEDFHQVATKITPGQFGEDGAELQYNIEQLVGARNSQYLAGALQNCVGVLAPSDGQYSGPRRFPTQFDDEGRFLEGPRKGKRMYERSSS